MAETRIRPGGWDDDEVPAEIHPLSRAEAEAFRRRHPPVSVWRVVAAQVAVGAGVAAVAWLVTGERMVFVSALYGAAVVAVPGALMARGATSANSRASPMAGAVSFMSWAVVKIGVSLLMLALAPRVVQPLSWPALLVAMVLCMKVYWFALLWRGRRPQKNEP
ncbi:MAG: ATP synthase subunit I [Burkholderiales bacterium]|nr:ATP synthase subunit I [Burkholderiales bacterium]